jgi:beta-lactamase regulating signal transducer with metallopeptidase domain
MGAPELMVLSLGLSVVVAGLGWAGGRGVERVSADPRLRDRVWAGALALPALPPLAVGLMLLTPAPVQEISLAATTLPAGLVPAPVGSAAAPSQAFALDPTMAAWIVLGVAAVLTAVRLAALALRAGRLLRVIGQAEAPGPAVTAMVEAAARDLAIRPPRVGVSAATSEALLASLGPARLILPVGLGEAAEAEAARAVIAHELAHLKRGDHRAVWLEEALLVALAFNPLMPVLRARRAAAREEACDALALEQAAPDIRRAYARSLIEALRDRAGPHASGGLPALTFTGAGRTTAMRRLKAVLNPAPAAGRGLRLTAFGLAGLIALLGGAGSLAVAGEREAVLVINAAAPVTGSEAAAERADGPAPAAASTLLAEQSRTVDLGPDTRTLLNGAPMPEGLPMWAVAAERVDVRTNGSPREVDLVLAFTGTVPVSVDGHRMPDGFPVSGVRPEAVARVETVGDHVMYTLKPEAEVRRDRMSASRERAAARMATDTARNALSPEQQARYRGTSARQYQAICTSADPGDDGFCSGVMFGVLMQAPRNGVCAPATVAAPGASGMELNIFVEIGKREVAAMRPNADEGAYEFARRALERAYPCGGSGAAESASLIGAGAAPAAPTVPGQNDRPRITPSDAVDVARIQIDKAREDGRTPPAVAVPARPAESDFVAERRAEREATRAGWPNERGLRLPGWPRQDRPTPGSPFANERRAADPQNRGAPRS